MAKYEKKSLKIEKSIFLMQFKISIQWKKEIKKENSGKYEEENI